MYLSSETAGRVPTDLESQGKPAEKSSQGKSVKVRELFICSKSQGKSGIFLKMLNVMKKKYIMILT